MGDAAGIGPEIVLKSLSDKSIFEICQPIIIGDARILQKTARDSGLDADFLTVRAGEIIPFTSDRIVIYDLENIAGEIAYGEESAITGKASAEYIEAAVRLWREGQISAMATAPIRVPRRPRSERIRASTGNAVTLMAAPPPRAARPARCSRAVSRAAATPASAGDAAAGRETRRSR